MKSKYDISKDIITSGGENISTIEVEGTLVQHPAVLDSAVVARPDDKCGETPCVFVTLIPESNDVGPEEIANFCRRKTAHFKVSKTVSSVNCPKPRRAKSRKMSSESVLEIYSTESGFSSLLFGSRSVNDSTASR